MGAIGAAIGGWLSPHDSEKTARTAALETGNVIGGASVNAIQRAQTLADRPYTAYDNERVAGMSGNEYKAMDLAAKGPADARGYFDKAGAQIDDVAGSAWNAETAQKYMDPYVGQVVDNTLRHENTAYQQSQNQLKGRAASMGAFGGDRASLLEAQGTQKHLQTVGDITAEGYSKAYSQAFQGWQADNQRKTNAASAYNQVGGNIEKLNSDQITDLMKTGQTDRVLRQLTDDTNYSAFIEKRDWDVNNLAPLLKAISVAKGGATAGQQDPGSNAAGDTLGAISAIAGYFGKGDTNNAWSQGNTMSGPSAGDMGGSYQYNMPNG